MLITIGLALQMRAVVPEAGIGASNSVRVVSKRDSPSQTHTDISAHAREGDPTTSTDCILSRGNAHVLSSGLLNEITWLNS